MSALRLSVLDQSVHRAGVAQDASIRETVALAQQAESWGYHRFWVSEHHALPTLVGTAPEILMAAIAARTTRIRIGSAGVMLPHYSAYKVAEQFRVLDALAPGRIDLGVGRAPGSDGRTARLLNPDVHSAEDFPRQVQELQLWVSGQELPPGHPGHGVAALPQAATAPSVWMLGSSAYGAQLAAHLGLPYAFAHFITDGEGCGEAIHLYRSTFREGVQDKPLATACLSVLAADTDEQAWDLFRSRERARIDRRTGRFGPLLPPEQASRAWSPAEEMERSVLRQRAIVGSAARVADQLRALAEQWSVQELVLVTWTWDPVAQRRSYELLAREFALP